MAVVQRSDAFSVALAACTHGVEDGRAEDILEGLIWVLQRKPDAHERAPGTDLRVAVTQVGDPVLRVFYDWDQGSDTVTLRHVEPLL